MSCSTRSAWSPYPPIAPNTSALRLRCVRAWGSRGWRRPGRWVGRCCRSWRSPKPSPMGRPPLQRRPLRQARRPNRGLRELLSPREQEVAWLVARGQTNRQIADELEIAETTAERHVANIMAKLDVHSRAQIAARAALHPNA
jgi:DNA-binding CsgD family transcriptional regulator